MGAWEVAHSGHLTSLSWAPRSGWPPCHLGGSACRADSSPGFHWPLCFSDSGVLGCRVPCSVLEGRTSPVPQRPHVLVVPVPPALPWPLPLSPEMGRCVSSAYMWLLPERLSPEPNLRVWAQCPPRPQGAPWGARCAGSALHEGSRAGPRLWGGLCSCPWFGKESSEPSVSSELSGDTPRPVALVLRVGLGSGRGVLRCSAFSVLASGAHACPSHAGGAQGPRVSWLRHLVGSGGF